MCLRKRAARQNVNHFARAMRKTEGLSHKAKPQIDIPAEAFTVMLRRD